MVEQVLAELERITQELEQLKKDYYSKSKELGQRLFRGFLEANPDVDKIRIVGYIPYFNDGDECVFGIYSHSYFLNNSDRADLSGDENPGEIAYYWSYKKGKGDPEEERYALFDRIVNAIPDEVYRDMFGDHFEVYIYSTGEVEINGYEHD